ncbi:MAG: DUF2845 domain-containing protein [Desulfuromonadaceae bacterium]|nr:DUF2845 domain-containing protein [Desulfuromonadaceae bacterium]
MKIVFTVCATVLCFSAPAFADNFRCPNGNIVSTGYSISTVAGKCDAPASSFNREEAVITDFVKENGEPGTKTVSIEVQEWTYNQGSTLLHTLIFRNGLLSEVHTGGFVE